MTGSTPPASPAPPGDLEILLWGLPEQTTAERAGGVRSRISL